MKPHPGFWQDIVAHPDDDTPRLIYADWLDDHDEPEQAELIRLQCELATLTPASDRYFQLQARESELLLGYTLNSDLPLLRGVSYGEHPARGFANQAMLHLTTVQSSQAFAEAEVLSEVLRQTPVRDIHLSASVVAARNLLQRPECKELHGLTLSVSQGQSRPGELLRDADLLGLRSLTLDSRVGEADIQDLANNPSLLNLESLGITRYGIGRKAMRSLLDAPWAPRLRRLRLYGFTPTAMRALCESRSLSSLHTLFLSDTFRCPDLLDLLSASRSLPNLASLSAHRIPLDPLSVRRFATRHAFDLRELSLWKCGLGDEGAEALAESESTSSLRHLLLCTNGISPRGVAALAQSPHLGGIRELTLSYNPLCTEGLQSLSESSNWSNLLQLRLLNYEDRAGAVTEDAGERFFRSLVAPNLRTLRVTGVPVQSKGALMLSQSSTLPGLRILDLSRTGITAEGARILVEAENLQQLIGLYLELNPLGDGVERLTSPDVMPMLRFLDLRQTSVPMKLLDLLRQRESIQVQW